MTKRASGLLLLLASFAVSAAAHAQPTWRELSRQRGEPPQLEGARAYFDTAPAFEGAVAEGTFVCRVEIARTRSYDGLGGAITRNYGAPDPTVTLRLGRTRAVVRGPEDAWSFYASVPNVRLRRRERLTARVVDRDVAVDDPVGDAAARFDGRLPITAEGVVVTTECRRVDPEEIARRLPETLGRADAEIARLSAATPDLDHDELGLVDERTALDALYDAAALVGWEHAEVARRRAAIDRARTEQRRRLAEALAHADASATELGATATGSPFAMRVTESPRCDVPALERRCGVRVALELDGPARLSELRVDTIRLDGTRHAAHVVGLERGDAIVRGTQQRLGAGSHVVWVTLDDGEAPLLRVRAVRGGTKLLVLR
ncbi:MAG: hypothetical protein H6724_13125 [Sandaracinus sp.]|nr:hypothetical protein [Sandaracinus sp.]